MDNLPIIQNAVAAIRVSSIKQGVQGDSPDAQKEQIERFAISHKINIKKFFIFLESASKDEQPVQEAIDYCVNAKNDIQLFIIKSIDRFTRGGSFFYDAMKMQLENHNVKLVDIYGVIGTQQVNTLEHLGISFKWSVYSPTKKAEILEAERAKDEMRDIMSRMIGAQIRYARLGYWVREAPYGFINKKIETANGKRNVLKQHPKEARLIKKMFELRCRGNMADRTIVNNINRMGFLTRVKYRRDKHDRTKIIKKWGGNPLNLHGFWRYVQNPIYAGVSLEKWTEDRRIKGKFDPIISIETFNQANSGKIYLEEIGDEIKIHKKKPPEYLIKKKVQNPKFPYKRVVLCPKCHRPLYGSASRGRLGKYYPAYHCNKRGHYFRVPKKDFDRTITQFIKNIQLAPGYTDSLVSTVTDEWNKRQKEMNKDVVCIDDKIKTLKEQSELVANKIRYLSSEVAIKYMEDDLVKADEKIADLMVEKKQLVKPETTNIDEVMAYVKYFLEHMQDLLMYSNDSIQKASLFGLIFESAPTYEELVSGTPKMADIINLNEAYAESKYKLAVEHGFEPRSRNDSGKILEKIKVVKNGRGFFVLMKVNEVFLVVIFS